MVLESLSDLFFVHLAAITAFLSCLKQMHEDHPPVSARRAKLLFESDNSTVALTTSMGKTSVVQLDESCFYCHLF